MNQVTAMHAVLFNLQSTSPKTLIVGIFNATPCRFSDVSEVSDISSALTHVCKMIDSYPEIIDIIGQSTRPIALQVVLDVDIRRIVPLIKGHSRCCAKGD
jgi:dihydropteroate synthase